MKKRIVALLLTLLLVVPAALASAATYYSVNTSYLKVHQFPQENAKTVASRERDFAMTVTKKIGDWSYVKFTNGDEGYVQNKYMKKTSSYAGWIASDDTPIRTGPAYDYSNVGTLAKGCKVTVLTHGTKYDYVKSPLGYGYVMNGFISKKKVKPSGKPNVPAFIPAEDYYAWISNGNRTVNLRSGAGTNFPIVQAYPTGTMVYVIKHGPVWDYVQIDSSKGYMMTTFLTTNEPAPDPEPKKKKEEPKVPYTAYVVTDNKEGANVRSGPGLGETYKFKAPYGAKVTVTEHGDKWDKIKYGTKTGWIQNKFLNLNPPPEGIVTPPPAPKPVEYPYTATITCKEGEKVNLRIKPWTTSTAVYRLKPGVKVKVTGPAKINGKTYTKWVTVQYKGKKLYVMKEFLK